jgi:hypothetical protein
MGTNTSKTHSCIKSAFHLSGMCWESLVSIVIGFVLDNWDFIPDRGGKFFFVPPCLDWLFGPPNLFFQWVPGIFSPGIKQPGTVHPLHNTFPRCDD